MRAEQDTRRGSARERGYTTAWDRASQSFKRAHPLCVGCEKRGRIEATFLVDHVIPHKGDQKLFWDRKNWQPACEHCGNAIKQLLERLYEQGKIPASELRLNSETAQRLIADELA